MRRAIFIGEGTSDRPLASIVETLFAREEISLSISTPEFERIAEYPRRDVAAKIGTALQLTTTPVDLIVIHRDADGAGREARLAEIVSAVEEAMPERSYLPVIPERMTEAWLLLDEQAIRNVAGNPRGRRPLSLPSPKEAERRAAPKEILAQALLSAADRSGRGRDQVARRFPQHRRRLLELLDPDGPVNQLQSWTHLTADIKAIANRWIGDDLT